MSSNDEIVKTIRAIIDQDLSDVDVLPAGVAVLQSYPADIVIPVLCDIFKETSNDYVQSRAYRQIITFPNFDSVQFLIEVFDQSDVNWQCAFCEDLSRFRDPRAVAKLCQIMLEHPNPDVRYNAAHALMVIGDTAALAALEYVSQQDEGVDFEEHPVADMAYTGLVKIGHKLDPGIEKYSEDLYFRRGASSQLIEAVEAKYHFRFPQDYREFLLISNGASGFVGDSQLYIFPLEYLHETDSDDKPPVLIPPGFLEFGTNLHSYAFDLRQAVPLFVEMPRMNVRLNDIKVRGATFREFLAYLYNRPHRRSSQHYLPDGTLVL
ncbi:MAG TPA: HEAT repeat domain-containing protein [Anaerovoracaceae bacterium]|nr:HEAT repeat domain-containing protein [Anaerovoracaceae bacterium]